MQQDDIDKRNKEISILRKENEDLRDRISNLIKFKLLYQVKTNAQ
jgi:hypothetical protein